MWLCALAVVRADGSRDESLYDLKEKSLSDAKDKSLYDAKCGECHGPAGRGSTAPSLVPFLWSDAQALKLVREPECDMPAIPASELSDEAVIEIFDYLRTIK
jgi:mono/diheme cytochrome c family protein